MLSFYLEGQLSFGEISSYRPVIPPPRSQLNDVSPFHNGKCSAE